jgi:basic membrane protein A
VNVISRKRGLTGLALVGAAGLLLSGCGAAPDPAETSAESDFLACAVSDEGSWNDNSFNEASMDGLKKAEKDLGVKIADAESASIEDFEPNLNEMIAAGCDVTFGVGFNLIDSINKAAEANPTLNFVTIDGYVSGDATNLKPIEYAMDQSSYLAGYLSAAYSTSKIVGTYGGLDIPAVTTFMSGFYYGAKAYETETGTPVTVLGWDPVSATGDFTDPNFTPSPFADSEGAKSISAGQLAQGADVIFPVAGGLFSATAEAIKESGSTTAVMLGVDKDIALTSPEYKDLVLTSVEKRMTQAVYDVIAATQKDGFDPTPYLGTLENDGTALSDFYDFDSKVPAELKAKLEELKQGIIDGTIDPLK